MKKLLFILGFIFWAHPAFASIAFVTQVASTTASTNSFVQNITTPSAGDALIFAWSNGAAGINTIQSITGGGVTWQRVTDSGSRRSSEVWCGLNSSGAATPITVTIFDGSGGVGINLFNISEFSGTAKTGGCAEQYARIGYVAGATILTTATSTILNSGDLLYAMVRSAGNFSAGPSNSFTALTTPPGQTSTMFTYRLPGTLGSYATAWAYSSGQADTLIVVIPPLPPAQTVLSPLFVFKNALLRISNGLFKIFSN